MTTRPRDLSPAAEELPRHEESSSAKEAFEAARERARIARENKEPADFEEISNMHPAWRPFPGEMILLDRHFVVVESTDAAGFNWRHRPHSPSLTIYEPRALSGRLAWADVRRGFCRGGLYTAQGYRDESMTTAGRPLDGDIMEIDGIRGRILATDWERVSWVPYENDPKEVLGKPRELAWQDLWHPIGEIGWKTRPDSDAEKKP